MVLGNLAGVFNTVFFEYALEHANRCACVTCGTVVPGILHVLDELLALSFEIREMNDGSRLFLSRLIDCGCPRRGSEIERHDRPSIGRKRLDNVIGGSCDPR